MKIKSTDGKIFKKGVRWCWICEGSGITSNKDLYSACICNTCNGTGKLKYELDLDTEDLNLNGNQPNK